MDQQIESENRTTLATIASYIAFPYIWLGLFVLLAALYHVGFFGQALGSILVPALLCLALLSPAIPLALTRFVVKPIIGNLLGQGIVSMSGCLTGLVSVVVAGISIIYLLSRGVFETAGWLFLAAPVVGSLLAAGVSLVSRGGGIPSLKPRTSAPPSIKVSKPTPRQLPGERERPALPSGKKPPSSVPAPRRRDRVSKPPSRGRTPPPRRRK